MKNKKGFTLIELLAVIVILAVVMLIAATAVIPMMTKSRKNALLDEGIALEKAAKLAYQDPVSGMAGKAVCYDLETLASAGFYEKSSSDKYYGSILIYPYPTGSDTFKSRIYITNANYGYKNAISVSGNGQGNSTSVTTYQNAIDKVGTDYTTYKNCGQTTAIPAAGVKLNSIVGVDNTVITDTVLVTKK